MQSGGAVRAFICEEATTSHMDELEARIDALERAVTDGDHDLSELATEGETRERLAAVEREVGDLVDRVAELEAATQALRGYVGNVRAVNRETEQRAEAALAKAESVESAIVGDRSGRDRPDSEGERSARSGDQTGVEENGRSSGAQSTPEAAGQQADPTRERGRPANTGRRSTATGSSGDSHDHPGRCAACGQPTENGAGNNRRGFEESNRTPTGGTGVGDATTGEAGDTSASETGVGKTGERSAGDPLDGVFEADEPESGDNGAFDRIREML